MRMFLGILGAILIVLGGASATSALISTVYDDTTYDNSINCTAVPGSGGGNDMSCVFATSPSYADHQFNQVLALGILGGSAMVTGGCLVAGACALSGRAAKRQDAPPYAVAHAGPR